MATFNFNVHPDNNLALHFADEAVSGGFNVDLSQLGLDDDDDQHVPAPATQPLFAENLIASLQRSQSKPSAMPTQDNNDMMRLFGPLSQAPSNKHGSGSFSANAPVTLTQIDPARASATTKALQALQARSRHPQAAADLADPNRGIAVDSSLFGSLPADIGSLDCTVYVQYLPVTMKEIEFMDLICQHGAPKRVRICGNPKKEHNWTYGFVEYGSPEEAAKFIRECDGIRAGPFRMRCNIAKTPIVDRLAIDAPPDGRCTFAQKFPNRTLRELILASISVTDDQNNGGVIITGGRDHHQAAPPPSQQPTVSERSRSDPPSEASVTSAASATHALSMPSEVALQLTGAIKDALRFLTDRNQSHFFAAKGAVQQCLEQAKRRAENLPPQLQIATLLNGTDTVFLCRLVLTALHILHGSYEDALRYALSALQAVPTPVAIVTYLNTLESAADGRTPFPRGLTPLMLNHLVCFGLLLEPVSVVAARAFFHMAKHRAAMHGYAANNALNVIVTSDLIPLARGGASLIRTLFPLLHTQQGGFPGYFFASMSTQFTPEQSCASLFSYPVPAAGTSEPATPSVVVGSVVTMNTRSAW